MALSGVWDPGWDHCGMTALVRMRTLAITMVAAWITALTAVGPSMASGSQLCVPTPNSLTHSMAIVRISDPAVGSRGIHRGPIWGV